MARSTRHRRIHNDTNSKSSSGLLSHVLSFVSREFESFVVNATASQPTSTGRVQSSGKECTRDPDRNMSDDEARYRSKVQHRRERERHHKRELFRRKPRSKSTDTTRKCRRDHSQPIYTIDDDRGLSASDRECSVSPTPRPLSTFLVPPPKLKKQPSITMPGSLFPRSPSLVPDIDQRTQAASNVLIHVQLSRPPYESDPDEAEPGPSWAHSSIRPNADPVDPNQFSLDQYVSPWRTRSVASVKDAVQRFSATDGAEADFSLMLPSPHSSPVKPTSKARSLEGTFPPHAPLDPATTATRKGKERAQDDWNDDDLEFIVGGSSGRDGVYAKERELDAAREEQREHERLLSGDQSRHASDERDRDKRRIKALEEEVRRLKEELSRSQLRSSPPPSVLPPTPPPPPPPPPPLRIDTAPYTPTSMFATARASLRHAMTPIEAPINPRLDRTRRQGQPTVNVPSEKMAAFLQEIKTAKLRKVGSGLNSMGGDGIAGPSGLSKSVSVTAGSWSSGRGKLSAQELLRRRSLASLRVPIGSSLAAPVPPSLLATTMDGEARVGQKRKADALGVDDVMGIPSKRHMTMSFSQSSTELSQRTSASSSEISLRSSLSVLPRPISTNETDVTTPSLCSDNDRDENSIEDRVPSTPPGPRTAAASQKTTETIASEEQIEVIDVDTEEQLLPETRAISSNSVPRRTSELFKKRPPTSPIPMPTPRRPTAPARTKRGATPKPKNISHLESDGDDEDGAPRQPTPVPFISLIPVPKPKLKAKPTPAGKGRPRAATAQQNGHLSTPSGSGPSSQSKRKKAHKRRQTLDEELRTAEARSSDIDECNDELDPERKEDDVFIATGTKSRRKGFLAHGGGGGAPVFMGVGYVEGATLDSEDESGVTEMQPPRRPSKPTSQASFIPRPKART